MWIASQLHNWRLLALSFLHIYTSGYFSWVISIAVMLVGNVFFLKTCITAIERIGSVFPPKLSGKTFHRGSAYPLFPPLATVLLWYTAWWVLMSDGRCRGLVGLVCGPPLHVLRRTRSFAMSVCVFIVFSSYSGLVLLKS